MPPPSPGVEPLSVVVPIVYDIEQNQTSIPQKDQININNPVMIGAQQILVNLTNSGALNASRCTIMPCVREILLNLTLPNEGPPNAVMMHPGMTRPPMPGPPHMAPQMGGPPMAPAMRPGMIPTMMPQQRMMMPQQPHPGGPQPPQGPQGPPHGYMG